MDSKSDSLTQLLNKAGAGDADAAAELLPLIYEELRRLARANMRGCRAGTTLQPTALVHEAFIRLFGKELPEWSSRGHFFSAAARAMRNIMVDQARRRGSLKRGRGRRRVDLDDAAPQAEFPSDDILALDEALDQLERSDPRKAQLVMLHCFAGLSLEETAAALGVSLTTVEREWRFTRALLNEQLSDSNRRTP